MAKRPPTTVSKEAVDRFMALFRGRENAHGEFIVQMDQGPTKNTPATPAMYQRHLLGQGNYLGIIPITLDNVCYFAGIDVDDYQTDHQALAAIIEHAGLPLVVCKTKSGGAHLYVFFKDPVDAKTVRQKLKSWIDGLKLRNGEDIDKRTGKATQRPIEIFPKQVKLKSDELGNWINIPYYGMDESNRYAVTSENEKLSFGEFLDYAESQLVSSFDFEAMEAGTSEWGKAPPCLETLTELGLPEGGRNSGLFNIAIALKAMHPDDWEDRLSVYNEEKVDPPLKQNDVAAVVRSVGLREYHYKCEELPLQPHCQKAECKKREFGIGMFKKGGSNGKKGGGKANHDDLPNFTNLRKVTTDPPRWILAVDGTDIELTGDDLLQMPRFRKVVMEKCHKIVPQLRNGEWDDVLTGLFDELTFIEAPPDAGISGTFRQLFNDFITRRKQARRREDLLAGMPVQEGPKVYFRSIDLMNFLKRMKFIEYNQSQLFTTLRNLGAGHDQLSLKGMSVQVWYIPSPADEQTEEFDSEIDTEAQL